MNQPLQFNVWSQSLPFPSKFGIISRMAQQFPGASRGSRRIGNNSNRLQRLPDRFHERDCNLVPSIQFLRRQVFLRKQVQRSSWVVIRSKLGQRVYNKTGCLGH